MAAVFGANAAADCVHLRIRREVNSCAGAAGRGEQGRLGPAHGATQASANYTRRGSWRTVRRAFVEIAAGDARRALPAVALLEPATKRDAYMPTTTATSDLPEIIGGATNHHLSEPNPNDLGPWAIANVIVTPDTPAPDVLKPP